MSTEGNEPLASGRFKGRLTFLRACIALTLAAPTCAGSLEAQVIRGRLLTALEDAAIESGRVELISEVGEILAFALTDAEGQFLVRAPAAGRYRLRGTGPFHEPLTEGPVEVRDGETIEVEFRLAPRAVRLDSLLVSVTRRSPNLALVGFYERARQEHGYFMTQQDIERRSAHFTADLLRHVPGVRIQDQLVGPPALYLRRRPSMDAGTECPPALYIDGVVHVNDRGTSVNDITPDQIAGIEVYSTQLRVPSAYAHGLTGCGVILIWTRR